MSFDYEQFRALANDKLVAYMEPWVNDTAVQISGDVFDRMLAELPTYDESHLVYALELGIARSARTFAPRIPQFLAHESASVFCTAYRSLTKLPNELLTQELLDSIQRAPVRETLFTDSIHGKKPLAGSSTSLIAELVGELTMRKQSGVT